MANINGCRDKNSTYTVMKMNYALVLGLCLTTSLTAQTNSSATKPAPKAKPAAPAKAIVEPTVSLVPGPATVNATRVQLRARSTIMGERLGRFNKGYGAPR